MSTMQAIRQLLVHIYAEQGQKAFERVAAILGRSKIRPSQRPSSRFSQSDVILITYGDSLRNEGEHPLKTLHVFASRRLKDSFSAVHFLPFFPFSSDDGFSVIDYFSVDPSLGSWQDITACGVDFDLMFDFVLNHVSTRSPWFVHYLSDDVAEDIGFSDLAIEVDPSTDLSSVTRPRALPLLTPFTKSSGKKVHLWTTFSADQVDLNYQSIDVLCKMIEVLLFYVNKGVRFIRMDAVAYLWKTPGTSCIHLPQTHAMVKLFRKILDHVAPYVLIITETNVPHAENVSYFGNGLDEAQMVYNFTLPPLLLHAFAVGHSGELSRWAQELKVPSKSTTFFNFTASHDGIGLRPLEGIVPPKEIERLVQSAVANGGHVSYKKNADGSQSPYELNLTYVDALAVPGQEGTDLHAARFLASQAIQLALPGVPAVYIHSILGSRNWHVGVARTGRARSINREKLKLNAVCGALDDPGSFCAKIFFRYCRLLRVRRAQSAFHPNAGCEVLQLDRRVFAVKRQAVHQTIFALTHIGSGQATVSLKRHASDRFLRDLLTGRQFSSEAVTIRSNETLWLVRPDDSFFD